jgi:hypothetical protein
VDASIPLFSTFVCKVRILLHGTMDNSRWVYISLLSLVEVLVILVRKEM